jgi:hypothetical protein
MNANTDRRGLAPLFAIALSLFLLALLLCSKAAWPFARVACFASEQRTCSSNNSQQLFNPYSFTHALHGIALFWLIAFSVRRRFAPRGSFG